MIAATTRITVDVNEEWLEAARKVLGTDTKVATINEALRAQAVKETARRILAALDSVEIDFSGSRDVFGYGGGRDLSALASDARDGLVA
jgi:Arc/MetJ family transcription regulator